MSSELSIKKLIVFQRCAKAFGGGGHRKFKENNKTDFTQTYNSRNTNTGQQWQFLVSIVDHFDKQKTRLVWALASLALCETSAQFPVGKIPSQF